MLLVQEFQMHRNLSTRPDAPDWLQADRIPRNAAADGLVRGLAAAWSQYVLFVLFDWI